MITPELQNCLTWLANAVAESVHHNSEPEYLSKNIRSSWGTFINSATKHIDWNSITVKQATELRFGKWDENSDLYLIPIWLYPMIPDDLELISIGGEKNFKANIDTDTRFGCLAWGINIKEEVNHDDCT